MIVDTAVGRSLHDALLADKPADASHNADICPFCIEKAADNSAPATSRNPASAGDHPDVSDENQTTDKQEKGGTSMTDISKETHEALLAKGIADATATTEQALATKTTEAEDAKARVTALEADNATLKTDNARLNSELDAAQVSLKAATDEVAELKKTADETAAAQAKADVATKRADQVRKLGTFDEDFVTSRADAWADLSDAAWDERLEEWAKLRGGATTTDSDAASAMSGTTGTTTSEPPTETANETKQSARRGVLGLAN